jgi:hypothetical protein
MADSGPVPFEIDIAEPGVGDREFGPLRGPRAERLPSSLPPMHPYQRLVANPFLAVLGVVLWIFAITTAYETAQLWLFLMAFFSCVMFPLLFQYHCLDCGKTGLVHRSSQHRCPHVLARYLARRPRRFRGPTAIAQTKIWIVFFVALGVYALIPL